MGCGSGQKDTTHPIRMNTVTGVLKITITNAVIFNRVSSFKMDPYVTLKLSNQNFTSKVVQNGDAQPVFSETFTFFINSCYRNHGRNLQLTLMDKKKVLADGEIGFGIVDLDPIINFKKPKDQFRCFVNYDRKQAGYINIVAEFKEEQAQTVSFRFETASIRRKTSTLGSMNCWVQVTIGEQTLQTTKQKDTKEFPPIWDKEILTFNVPSSAKEALIVVMDDDAEIGRMSVETSKLFAKNDEQAFNQQFEFENSINAGSLKFQTLTGFNPIFSVLKTNHRKPKEEPKKEEGKQQADKKDQPKKEEPKKEAPKQEKKVDPAQPTQVYPKEQIKAP